MELIMKDFKYSDTQITTIKVYPDIGIGAYKVRLQIPKITEEYVEAWVADNLKNVQSWEFWDEANSQW